jgi:hypothetical protein
MVKCHDLVEIWTEFSNNIYRSFGFNRLMKRVRDNKDI